ncbi:MAG: hypothetical protein Q9209_001990 [Squamulea sp. 1 TL-2023]
MEASNKYIKFTHPIRNGSGSSFDVHVYFEKDDGDEVGLVEIMRLAIKEEFPELAMYNIRDKAVGPHPLPMFEVDIFTPAQFGALIPWLTMNHGPLSVLIHPDTGNSRRDHSQNALWIGKRVESETGYIWKRRGDGRSGKETGECIRKRQRPRGEEPRTMLLVTLQ